jgi:hypothetical protein
MGGGTCVWAGLCSVVACFYGVLLVLVRVGVFVACTGLVWRFRCFGYKKTPVSGGCVACSGLVRSG